MRGVRPDWSVGPGRTSNTLASTSMSMPGEATMMHGILRTTPPSVDVLGVPVTAYTEQALVDHVLEMTRSEGVDVAVGVNASVCTMARRDPAFRDLVAGSHTYADGQSVVWAGRLLGVAVPERLATTDVALPILRAAAENSVPVYFLGAAPGVAETAATAMREKFPGLELRTHHGYLQNEDVPNVLADIRAHRTGILFVGMGDPAQQIWIDAHRDQLPPAVLTCGGLFDWLSGTNRRAPRWMITAGLEWLWRLGLEPRRLWRRYVIGNTVFIAGVLAQRLRRSHR